MIIRQEYSSALIFTHSPQKSSLFIYFLFCTNCMSANSAFTVLLFSICKCLYLLSIYVSMQWWNLSHHMWESPKWSSRHLFKSPGSSWRVECLAQGLHGMWSWSESQTCDFLVPSQLPYTHPTHYFCMCYFSRNLECINVSPESFPLHHVGL